MDGIFDELFDMNMDGEVDTLEQATGFAILEEITDEECRQEEVGIEEDEEEECIERQELENAGLDIVELESMDEDERREAIEDAGLDPDDFEFFE